MAKSRRKYSRGAGSEVKHIVAQNSCPTTQGDFRKIETLSPVRPRPVYLFLKKTVVSGI